MATESKLTKDQIINICTSYGFSETINYDFIHEVYSVCKENVGPICEQMKLPQLRINDKELVLYIVNEHLYTVASSKIEKASILENDEKYLTRTASLALDKLITNENYNANDEGFTNKYSPVVSTLELFINYALGLFKHKFERNNPKQTLIIDMLNKCFQLIKCDLFLLINGFETVALSTWRTLHESECIVKILYENRGKLEEAYLRHLDYSKALKGSYSKEKTDKIFEQIKNELRMHDLKSKDIKKYIEYGWMYAIPGADQLTMKLNFRDGLETFAGLSDYSKTYEMSSEVTHSSPFLIYSKRNYFYYVTLLNLYETFFRLEKIFTEIISIINTKQEQTAYTTMRDLYYNLLLSIYNIEKGKFEYTFGKIDNTANLI